MSKVSMFRRRKGREDSFQPPMLISRHWNRLTWGWDERATHYHYHHLLSSRGKQDGWLPDGGYASRISAALPHSYCHQKGRKGEEEDKKSITHIGSGKEYTSLSSWEHHIQVTTTPSIITRSNTGGCRDYMQSDRSNTFINICTRLISY